MGRGASLAARGACAHLCGVGNPARCFVVQSDRWSDVNRTAHEHELTDVELVERARGGVPSAFAQLVSRYQDRIYNTCYRMCHNDADALDLTQATFLRALESLDGFRGKAGFYTWIFRIAVNLVISHRRKNARRRTISLDVETGDARAPGPRLADDRMDNSLRIERGETRERIAWALQQLEDEFRAAVVLKDIEGLDYASIAQILSVPIGTAKSRIHRARMMLRDLLADERTQRDRAKTGPA